MGSPAFLQEKILGAAKGGSETSRLSAAASSSIFQQATHNTVACMESLRLEKNFRMKLGLQTECNKYLSHYQHLLWARLALTATDGEMHSPSHAVHRAQQLLSCTAGDEQVCLFPTPLPSGAHLKWSTFTSKIHRPQQIPIRINLCFC